MSTQDIKNLVVVSDLLATAGQPTEEQLRALAGEGYQVVINLGLMDPRYCLADEAALARACGLQYHHIPVEFSAPRHTQLAQFFALMDENAERKVLVHCAANYRVTGFVALYGIARWGWTRERADAFITQVWTPDPTWRAFIDAASPCAAIQEKAA
jgi:protein tyrosine phosphatase (PTP) superfamily phosphohydrolase (DUF442 family)